MKEVELKTLIFDLGGVIIDLHIDRTISAFSKLANLPKNQISKLYGTSDYFFDHEKGLISDAEFRESVRSEFNFSCSDTAFDNAWNAMLGDINPKRVEKLLELKKFHNLYLLSNTNSIHVPAFTEILYKQTGQKSLHDIFNKVYFSHEINMRKPDLEIFDFVINDNSINPEEALFLDDTFENLKGAENLGINSLKVTHPDMWLENFYGGE